MPNQILPFPINKPILDLTSIVTHPLGEEIGLALISFISIFLTLWLLSKIFNFKKQDYKIPFFIALIVTSTSFIIRSINLIFSLTDAQKPIFNGIAMIAEIFLLLILIKKSYNLKWLKSILTLIITYFGRLMILSLVTIVILLFFTTIPQDIAKESEKFGTLNEIQARTNFGIVEPTYLPKGYSFLNVMSLNNNSVRVHYQYKVKNKNYGFGITETFTETKPKLQDGEIITINGEEAILDKGPYGELVLTWYSSRLKLLFFLSTGVNGGLDKDEVIKIAESISD